MKEKKRREKQSKSRSRSLENSSDGFIAEYVIVKKMVNKNAESRRS